MEKQIFKVGDKVFDILFGWGEVIKIVDGKYPITVKFNTGIEGYTFDGRYLEEALPSLSFTEYTINGFSQERPIELPEIGEMVMVSNDEESWYLREVTKIVGGKVYTNSQFFTWKFFKRLR